MEALFKKVLAFVASEVCKPGGRAAVRISLYSSSPGMRGDEIATWLREEDPSLWSPEGVPQITDQIIQRAQADADGIGPGAHRYRLVAQNQIGGQSRLPIRVRGTEDAEDEGTGEEMATPTGLLGQLMRHNEAQARLMAQSFQGITNSLVRRMEAMDSRMAGLEKERADTFLALEAANSQASERTIAEMKAVAGEKRKEQAFDKLAALAPAVVNRLAGNKLLPEAKTPRDMMIETFRDSLTPEQRSTIAQSLRPEQVITLIELLRAPEPAPSAITNGVTAEKAS